MTNRFAITVLLTSVLCACFELGDRHGVAIEVRRVEELQPGGTNLAGASAVLGHEPSFVAPTEDGGTRAVWWSYFGDEGRGELIIPEYAVFAQFDVEGTLVSVTAADFRRKDFWYYPDCDQFMAEYAPKARH